MRVGLAWLERRLRDGTSMSGDDIDDWLAGNDDAIALRRAEARRAAVLDAGGQVG